MLHPPLADRPIVDEQRRLAAGCRRRAVGLCTHTYGHVASRKIFLGDLREDQDAHHRIRVGGELAVLDVEREPAQVIGLGDDHAFGAAFGHDQVCSDRVRAVINAVDHARHHVDVAGNSNVVSSGIGGKIPKKVESVPSSGRTL